MPETPAPAPNEGQLASNTAPKLLPSMDVAVKPGETTSEFKFQGAAAIAALTLGAVHAQDKPVMVKMASWVPAQHALNPALQAWGRKPEGRIGRHHQRHLVPLRAIGQSV